ncbi:hypothetical protein E2P64_00360 [Candidatus Bathyarchaeota archaeon]|nr:hypothetical protein E2P64_00360 [Candidatus Bathyarchaeota archaeon]
MRLLLAFLLLGTYALNFSYDGEVFVAPGEDKTIDIYIQSVNESGKYWVTCSSDMSMTCPNYVEVLAGKEMRVPLSFEAALGAYPVNVTIGKRLIQFVVKSSNQTHVFYDGLAQYEETFNNLETKHGPHHLIELGKLLVSEGFGLYEKGEYAAVDGVTGNLDKILGEYYAFLEAPEVEEEPARLGLSLAPVLGACALFALYVRSTRKPKQGPGTEELSKLLEKEGVTIGGKEEKG